MGWTQPKVLIRKNGLLEELYLSSSGKWVDRSRARRCSRQESAERFALRCGLDHGDFGLFPASKPRRIPDRE